MMQYRVKRITFLGLLVTVGILLGYLESLIVLPIGIPGIKLGLSNIITVIILYLFGKSDAMLVLAVRILLSAFLFGNGFSLVYSLCGAVCSFIIMALIYRLDLFSVVGVSILGGVMHNIGQLLVAGISVMSFGVLYYMPVLLISGAIAGMIVGVMADKLIIRLERIYKS